MEDLIAKFHSHSAIFICMSIRHENQKQAFISLKHKNIRKTKANKEVT